MRRQECRRFNYDQAAIYPYYLMPHIKSPLLLEHRNTLQREKHQKTWRDFKKFVKPFLAKEEEFS
jgi:hypothetical protein